MRLGKSELNEKGASGYWSGHGGPNSVIVNVGCGRSCMIVYVNVVEMRTFLGICDVFLRYRIKNSVIVELRGVKDDLVTGMEMGVLRWFDYVERMDVNRISTHI